jgi:hypothetical protein
MLLIYAKIWKLLGNSLLQYNVVCFLENTSHNFLCMTECRNPSFGLTTKAKGVARLRAKKKEARESRQRHCKKCGPRGSPGVKARGSPGVTSHTPGSVRKCEGVWGSEPSHSQGNSHLGRWSPSRLPKLEREIAGVKNQWLVALFISLESFWNVDV